MVAMAVVRSARGEPRLPNSSRPLAAAPAGHCPAVVQHKLTCWKATMHFADMFQPTTNSLQAAQGQGLRGPGASTLRDRPSGRRRMGPAGPPT